MVRLRGWQWLVWVAGAGLLLGPGRAVGQDGGEGVRAVLVEMASRAGVIFAGQVTGITRTDERGFVEVRFRVEVPVRGVRRVGFDEYVMREWAGLWTGGDRYRVGQRYLMLLMPRGAAGLSGPVNGMDGAVPLMAAAGEALADGAAAEMTVDLRWIEAGVLRGKVAEAGGRRLKVGGRFALDGAEPIVLPGRGGPGPGKVWGGAVAPLGSGPAGVTLGTVVGMLQVGGGTTYVAR